MNRYLPLLIAVAPLALILFLPIARTGAFALGAYREKQRGLAAGAALDVVTAGVATLVARAEIEVRDLKDPLKPGSWNPAVDGPRVLKRVVDDYWRLGSASWLRFRALEKITPQTATKLLEDLAHEQLLLLRSTPTPGLSNEVALDVAAHVSAPTAINPQRGAVDVRVLLALIVGVAIVAPFVALYALHR